MEAITVLEREVNKLHDRIIRLEEWADVISSPLYKRVWFVLCGWRWKTLGRWRGIETKQWPPPTDDWWK